jgi:putative transposase
MVPAYGCARSMHTMSGRMISSIIPPMTCVRLMPLIDEHSRQCLAIRVERHLKGLTSSIHSPDGMRLHGVTTHPLRHRPEMSLRAVRAWLAQVGARTLFIEPGSPRENGSNESVNGKLRVECLNGEIFYRLKKAQVLIEQPRCHYNPADHAHRWVTDHQPALPSTRKQSSSRTGAKCSRLHSSHMRWSKVSVR